MTKKIDWKKKHEAAMKDLLYMTGSHAEICLKLQRSEQRCEDFKKHVEAGGNYIRQLEGQIKESKCEPTERAGLVRIIDSKDEQIIQMKQQSRGLLRAHIIAKSEAEKAKAILSIIAGKDPEKNIASFALEEMTRARRAIQDMNRKNK